MISLNKCMLQQFRKISEMKWVWVRCNSSHDVFFNHGVQGGVRYIETHTTLAASLFCCSGFKSWDVMIQLALNMPAWIDLPSRFAKLLDETLAVSPKSWEQAGSSSCNKGQSTPNYCTIARHTRVFPHSCKFNVHGHCQCLESCLRSHP